MADILFEELAPVLNYFPVKIGKAEMFYVSSGGYFLLAYDNLQWCTLNVNNRLKNREAKEFFIDLNLAQGKIVTTGLGFGIIQSILSLRENVSEVIVYEKYEDIIKMFLLFAKESNFDTSKIKIVNEDASNSAKEHCDWLLMDHFECAHQPYWEVIDAVREISYDCNASNILFWPMHSIFITFCTLKQIPFNSKSYALFRSMIKINKLPATIDDALLSKLHYFPEAIAIEEARKNRQKKL